MPARVPARVPFHRLCLAAALAAASLGTARPGVAAGPAGPPYPRPHAVERVSIATDGTEGDHLAYQLAMSDDGAVVAFESYASNLVPGDTNRVADVFVRDRRTGTTIRVAETPDGAEPNGQSSAPDLSADGRWVAFSSDASTLAGGDRNHSADVFVRDLVTGAVEAVSVNDAGELGNGYSNAPSISDDGRWVAFESSANNLVPGDTNVARDVFVRDRAAGRTYRVSTAAGGAQADAGSGFAAVSGDGRRVAFSGYATNLVAGTGATGAVGGQRVYVKDVATGAIEHVSVGTDGAVPDRDASRPSLSYDGTRVAFTSFSDRLVPGDTNGVSDVFVRDLAARRTRRVSVTSAGAQAASGGTPYSPGSYFGRMSPDGRYVVFQSESPDFAAGDTRNWDVFLHDLVTGETSLVSARPDGTSAGGGLGVVGSDGAHVGFASDDEALVAGDANRMNDVFVATRGPAQGPVSLTTAVADRRLTTAGVAAYAGEPVAAVADPDADATGAGGPAGAEITAAEVVHRPDLGDLLFRVRFATLPDPTVGHVVAFATGPGRWEVRGSRTATGPLFSLWRCDTVCTHAGDLTGGIGSTDAELTVAVPLAAVGAADGSGLTGAVVRAVAAVPDAVVAPAYDEVLLGAVRLGTPGLAVSLTRPGDEPEWLTAGLDGRAFAGAWDVSGRPGERVLRVRACFAARCTESAYAVTVPPGRRSG